MLKANCRLILNSLLIGLLAILFSGCRAKEEVSSAYEALLPQEAVPEGWERSQPVKVYPGKKLYDSIDGAADRFFQYAFSEQYVATYKSKKPGRTIQVEVYDMETPADAFGIFSCHDNIVSRRAQIGLAATISEMNLDFCEGKYFVRLQALGFQGGEAESALRAFGEAIARNVKPAAELPELVRRLPQGYLEGTVMFFHTWPTLNERRYIAEENLFRLNQNTAGVLAAYSAEEKGSEGLTFKLEKDTLFLVEYPGKEETKSARTSYGSYLEKLAKESQAEGLPESDRLFFTGAIQEPMEIFQLYKGQGESQRLIMNMRVYRNYIFGVWEITDPEKARSLVKSLAENLSS